MKVAAIIAGVVAGYFALRQVGLMNQRWRERPLAAALGGKLKNSTFPIGAIDLRWPEPGGGRRICKVYWNDNGIAYFRVKAKRDIIVIPKQSITGMGVDPDYRVLAVCVEGDVHGWEFGTQWAFTLAAAMVNGLIDDYPVLADEALELLNRVRGPLAREFDDSLRPWRQP